MMSKHDYQLVADSFSRQFAALDPLSDFYKVEYAALVRLRDDLIESFKRQNPRFNPGVFIREAHILPAPLWCGHKEYQNRRCGEITCSNYYHTWEERRRG